MSWRSVSVCVVISYLVVDIPVCVSVLWIIFECDVFIVVNAFELFIVSIWHIFWGTDSDVFFNVCKEGIFQFIYIWSDRWIGVSGHWFLSWRLCVPWVCYGRVVGCEQTAWFVCWERIRGWWFVGGTVLALWEGLIEWLNGFVLDFSKRVIVEVSCC